MGSHKKIRVDQITIDHRFQRELDEARATAMSKQIDWDRIGVPALSQRDDGKLICIDGQHRVSAIVIAGLGSREILCEVFKGLTLAEEAALFLKLNGGRKAPRAFDHWRAELVAERPVALEIQSIVSGLGMRVARGQARNCVCAVDAIRSCHLRYKNLREVLWTLREWADEDPIAFKADLIKAVAIFLATYPSADPKTLVKKLEKYSPERISSRIGKTTSRVDRVPFGDAAAIVLREIYNHRSKVKLMPLHRLRAEREFRQEAARRNSKRESALQKKPYPARRPPIAAE